MLPLSTHLGRVDPSNHNYLDQLISNTRVSGRSGYPYEGFLTKMG